VSLKGTAANRSNSCRRKTIFTSVLNTKTIRGFTIVMFIILVVSVTGSFVHSPGTGEFRFHRTRYEQIIAKVKALGIAPGTEYRYLYLSSGLDPATLGRKRVNNTDMEGMVEVFRDDTIGARTIIITTLDRGHFGTFGYAYAETPNSFPPPGSMWGSEEQIDAHWWIAANRSW
jgi:hypothetical protein